MVMYSGYAEDAPRKQRRGPPSRWDEERWWVGPWITDSFLEELILELSLEGQIKIGQAEKQGAGMGV